MSVFLTLLFLYQFGALTLMYIVDKRLYFALKSDIIQTKMIELTKYKYFFVFYRRKYGLISSHAFWCMIVFYGINFTGIVIMLIQYTIMNSPLLTITCSIIGFLNLGLVIAIIQQPKLTFDERRIIEERIAKERAILRCEKYK